MYVYVDIKKSINETPQILIYVYIYSISNLFILTLFKS